MHAITVKTPEIVIFVRHGQPERRPDVDPRDEDLSRVGVWEIRDLGNRILSIIGKRSVRILSSTWTRASSSAKVLASSLGLDEAHVQLHSSLSPDRRLDNDGILRLVDQAGTEVVIAVTHQDYTDNLPGYFGAFRLGVDNFPIGTSTPHAAAWIIDCEEETCRLV